LTVWRSAYPATAEIWLIPIDAKTDSFEVFKLARV
jgi:hypothetical protein